MSNFIINPYQFVSNGLLNNLVSYWKADTNGSFPDAHGSNTGTITGATYTASGKINGAYSFDGINDKISIPDDTSLRLTTALTMSCWYKKTTGVANPVIFRKDTPSGTRYLRGFYEKAINTVAFSYFNGSVFQVESGNVNDGNWHHFVGTINGTTLEFFVDNVSQGTATISGTQGAPTGPIGICYEPFAGGGPYANGVFDEAAIWSTPLDGSQRAALYNGGSGLSYDLFTT